MNFPLIFAKIQANQNLFQTVFFLMFTALKCRLYPTTAQKAYFEISFDAARFTWNKALEYKQALYKKYGLTMFVRDLKAELVFLKQAYPFLSQTNSQSLDAVAEYLDNAYQTAFKRLAEKKAHKNKKIKVGFPKFKARKKNKPSFTNRQSCKVDYEAGTISIPKCRGIKAVLSRRLEGDIQRIVISRESDGHYYAAILFKTPEAAPNQTPVVSLKQVCGIDMGLTDLFITSDGNKVANPRHWKQTQERLTIAQRKLARAKPDSANRAKKRLDVARAYRQVVDTRKDTLHKQTTKLVQSGYDAFVLETLNTAGLLKNKKLAKHIADASWSLFKLLLTQKCTRTGKTLVSIDRWFPSSQLCSDCGFQSGPKPLDVRAWTCKGCGSHHDRDINAAVNIQKEGFRLLQQVGNQ